MFSCVVGLHRSEDRFNHGRRLLLEAALLTVLSMLFNRIWCRNRRWLCIWQLALLEQLTDKQLIELATFANIFFILLLLFALSSAQFATEGFKFHSVAYTDLRTVFNDMMTCFTTATNVLSATPRVSRSVSATVQALVAVTVSAATRPEFWGWPFATFVKLCY